jgi:hypothetical protein
MPQGGVAVAGQRLCSGGSTGRGVLGLGAALAWGMRYRGARAVLIGRRSVLGVRARDGNLAVDLGVMVVGAARVGKKGLACGPRLSAAGNDALCGVWLGGEAGRGACGQRERAERRGARAAGLAGLSTRIEGAGSRAGRDKRKERRRAGWAGLPRLAWAGGMGLAQRKEKDGHGPVWLLLRFGFPSFLFLSSFLFQTPLKSI